MSAAQRIEKGLRRIQAAADARATGGNGGAAAAEFSHLASRHDALRDEVRETLRVIDSLIASQGRS